MKQLGSPAPKFELEIASMTCVLPAHPRHELLRHVAEIERLLVQQDTDQAQAKLDELLIGYPTAPNLLDFLSHIAIIQRRPERVGEYIRKITLTPDDLPTPTVFQLIEALRESADAKDQSLAREWLSIVSKRRLEAAEVKLAVLALRKLGRNEDAVQLIGRFIASQSSPLAVPAALYDIRARAKIDLAKKCMDTGRDKRAQSILRGRAWEQCRQYLEEAEADIMKAIQNEPNPRDQEYYQKDLEFVRQIREQSRRPDERRRGSFGNRGPRRNR